MKHFALAAFIPVAFAALVVVEREASACGAAYPGGPMICTLEDAPGRQGGAVTAPPVARVAASWAYTSTIINFHEGRRADLTRHTVFGGTEIVLGKGLGLRFGAGGVVGGELDPAHEHGTLGPGVTGYVGVAKTILDDRGAIPFVQLSLTVSGTRASTHGPGVNDSPTLSALDFRGGATVGKTIGGWFVPYLALRAFGGPVDYKYFGKDVTGTDLYHYQVGAGFSASLPKHVLDIFVEGIAFGEKGVSAGVGTSF